MWHIVGILVPALSLQLGWWMRRRLVSERFLKINFDSFSITIDHLE